MNEIERMKRQQELDDMKRRIANEERKLSSMNIPIEPQDIQYDQPSLSPPIMTQPPHPSPTDKITKRQAAFEVAKELDGKLDGKKVMSMMGMASGFMVLILAMFSSIFGLIGVAGFTVYFAFIFWRTMRRRNYLRHNYDI